MSTHSNIPDDVAALITAHALGALEPDQAALAEQHIAASDDCRRAYEDALETAAALALAVADSEPPADLRERIVAAARAERARGGAGVARSCSAPAAAGRMADAVDRLRRPRRRGGHRVRAGRGLAARFGQQRARPRAGARGELIAAPDARVVPMLPSGGGEAGGRVVVANGRAALVNSMATPPSGRTYQAWGLPAGGGAPVPLPTFSSAGRRGHRAPMPASTTSCS